MGKWTYQQISLKTDVFNVFLLIGLFTMRMTWLISVLLFETHDEYRAKNINTKGPVIGK